MTKSYAFYFIDAFLTLNSINRLPTKKEKKEWKINAEIIAPSPPKAAPVLILRANRMTKNYAFYFIDAFLTLIQQIAFLRRKKKKSGKLVRKSLHRPPESRAHSRSTGLVENHRGLVTYLNRLRNRLKPWLARGANTGDTTIR